MGYSKCPIISFACMKQKGDWLEYALMMYLMFHLTVGHGLIKLSKPESVITNTPPSPQETPFVPYQNRPNY